MDKKLFDETKIDGVTIKQAAQLANVSTVTILNWVKTGYLTIIDKGIISQKSLDNFMSNIAGKEKLKSRANKLLKDKHDHTQLSSLIKRLSQKCCGEELGTEYENSLSDSFRNKEGIYYTPPSVVVDMLKDIPINANTKFLDPCCGSGNFIIQAIKSGISPENVYGFDLDENAVFISKKRIKDEFGFETPNIKVGNFFIEALKLKKKNIRFDLIFTNPPWGKKMDKSNRKQYSKFYNCGDSLDTTSLFMGASLDLLNTNGFLGFLIQEAFFNIGVFKDIRARVISKKILRFVDYGKVFKKLVTKAQTIIVANCEPDANDVVECCFNNEKYYRPLSSFVNNPKNIFNFWTKSEDSHVIERLYSHHHITLKDKADWALGIVTGNNEKYCSKTKISENHIPIYKGSDITKKGLKEVNNFIINDFSRFQQVAPLERYLTNEKLIYRFISSNLCFCYDDKHCLVLNSANVLIPKNITITAKQLTQLLNSEIINWLFKKLFLTHKVLRGDLEYLPIHTEYFKSYKKFSEKTYLEYLKIEKTKKGEYRVLI